MSRRRTTLFVCQVCGHVEVTALDVLPDDYACPLCAARRAAMWPVDDPRVQRQGLRVDVVAPGVVRLRRTPALPPLYEHSAYALLHDDGVVLYDAPAAPPTPANVATLQALGKVRALVVSHADFVGAARAWADALGVPAWMGDEPPLPGSGFVADVVVTGDVALAPDLRVVVTPGHSPAHLALLWSRAAPVLVAGDMVTLSSTGVLSLPQAPPVHAAVLALLTSAPVTLCMCMGVVVDVAAACARLAVAEAPCARPWRGEAGGVALTDDERARGT